MRPPNRVPPVVRHAHRIFVLGGTRSGKSRYGRERALVLGGDEVTFVATAWPGDVELDARIAAHRADRPPAWRTIETGADLAHVIAGAPSGDVLLIDSLTLWVSAAMEEPGPVRDRWQQARAALDRRAAPVIIVSDEVGLGIVPMDAGVREFRDELGWIHQSVAGWADEVYFLVAGIAMRLKGP
jgi:adenosylcobinamide kinase/adenosylcobinamide-phosphate guanylyltransferase